MDAFKNMIAIYAGQKKFKKALAICESQIEKVKKLPKHISDIYSIEGSLYLAMGNKKKAKTAFDKAINVNLNNVGAYFALAKIALSEKDEDEAIKQYEKTLELYPKQIQSHMLLGTIYESQNKLELAEKHYRDALAVKPDFVPAANNLAYMLAEKGEKLDEALVFAKIAKEHAPAAANIMDTLGWAYYKKGFYESAVSEFRDCLAKMPDNATVNYHLGLAYYKLGESAKSKIQLEKALRLDANFEGAENARNILSKL